MTGSTSAPVVPCTQIIGAYVIDRVSGFVVIRHACSLDSGEHAASRRVQNKGRAMPREAACVLHLGANCSRAGLGRTWIENAPDLPSFLPRCHHHASAPAMLHRTALLLAKCSRSECLLQPTRGRAPKLQMAAGGTTSFTRIDMHERDERRWCRGERIYIVFSRRTPGLGDINMDDFALLASSLV